MNFPKSFPTLQQLERPSNYSIIKRLFNLTLVIVGVLICFNLWSVHSEQSETWYKKQANQLGRSLSQLSVKLLAEPVVNQDTQAIQKHLSYLVEDNYVAGAALYDQKGQLLQEKGDQPSIVTQLKTESPPPLVFIQTILSQQDEILGYLRLVLDEERVMQYHFDYQQQMTQQIEVLLILAAIIGLIITRAFYTVKYRQYRTKPVE